METAKVQARDTSQQAIVEANLRAALSLAVKEKNEALQLKQTFEAKCSLLSEQLHCAKTKLARSTQENIQTERAECAPSHTIE